MDWSSILYYSQDSPSGLRWKIRSSTHVYPDSIAGTPDKQNYWQIRYRGKFYKAHRIIWELHNERLTSTQVIDHIDRNPANNKIENLRVATRSENQWNSKSKKKYKGISLHRPSGLWTAKIMKHGKTYSLKYFNSPEEAHKAYCEAADKLHGEFACYN